jgi:CBS domain-containing protein
VFSRSISTVTVANRDETAAIGRGHDHQSLLGPKSAEVFTIRATETVKSAAEQMRQHGVSALVVKGVEAMGMISDRDIVYAVSRRGEAAISLAVSDIMSHSVVTVAPGDSLKRVMGLMVRHRVRDLPVMADGELVGVVAIGDVAKYRLEDLETESNVLRDAYIALAVAKPT